MNRSDVYFAEEPTTEFARRFFGSAGGAGNMARWAGPIGLISQAFQTFHGSLPFNVSGWGSDQGSSAFVQRSGEQGEELVLRDNYARRLAQTRHQMVTNDKLSWQVEAVDDDSSDLKDAVAGRQILEFLWKEGPFEKALVQACLDAIILSEGFVFTPWDRCAGPEAFPGPSGEAGWDGDVGCYSVMGWNVLRDPAAATFEDSPWLCVCLAVDRFVLAGVYPDSRDIILSYGSTGGMSGAPGDRVVCYYFYHKRTAACPDGRASVMLGSDAVLHDGPLPEMYWQGLPVHRVADVDVQGTPYADCNFWEVMAMQRMLDRAISSVSTTVGTFGMPHIWSQDKEDDLSMGQIVDGPRLIHGPGGPEGKPPEVLDLCRIPPQMMEYIEGLKRSMRDQMGLNDTAFGQTPPGVTAAKALGLLQATTVQQNSDLQKRYHDMVSHCGKCVLSTWKHMVSEPRKVAVTGVHGPGRPSARELSGKDILGVTSVYVKPGNPLTQRAEGRAYMAETLMQYKIVNDVQDVLQIYETGRPEPLVNGARNQQAMVASENEALGRGETPSVYFAEDHAYHMSHHKDVLTNEQAKGDPRVVGAVTEHIMEHDRVWYETSVNNPGILLAAGYRLHPGASMGPPQPPQEQKPSGGGGDRRKNVEGIRKQLGPPGDQTPPVEPVKPSVPPDVD